MKKEINLEARNAFARVPFPEYWGLDAAEVNLRGYDEEAFQAVDYRNVADLLRANTEQSLRAKTQTGYLVVSSEEYGQIPRNVDALSRAVRAKTSAAGRGLTSYDSRVRAGERGGAHVLEGIVPNLIRIQEVARGPLEEARSFKEETSRHWQAHITEARMRTIASGVFYGAPDLIEVAAEAHKWSAGDLERAKEAMVYRFVGGPRGKGAGENFKAKKKYFSDIAGVIIAYNQAKINLLTDKIDRCQYVIGQRLAAAEKTE